MPRAALRLLWCLYAVLFAALALAAFRDDLSLEYSRYFVWPAAASYVCVLFGILAHAFELRRPALSRNWRRFFPLLVALPLIGIVGDAFRPSDYNLRNAGLLWIRNTLLVVALMIPGYVANWRFTQRSS